MRLYDRFRKEMNMNNKILITTLSKTGFTRKYAEMIAEEIPCTLADFQKPCACRYVSGISEGEDDV